MKRDMDLVRRILLEAENVPPEGGRLQITGYTTQEINQHLFIMEQAGLILFRPPNQVVRDRPGTALAFNEVMSLEGSLRVRAVTWSGHNFLDDIRNDTTWTRVKQKVAERGGSASFSVVVALAEEMAKRLVLGS